jgi:hypothetical protein
LRPEKIYGRAIMFEFSAVRKHLNLIDGRNHTSAFGPNSIHIQRGMQ